MESFEFATEFSEWQYYILAPELSMKPVKFRNINRICKIIDRLNNIDSIIGVWNKNVLPNKKKYSLSHLNFMYEYIEEKINKL